MTTVIWKYRLEVKDLQVFEIPYPAKVLGVVVYQNSHEGAYREGVPFLYAIVDPSCDYETIQIYTIPTGEGGQKPLNVPIEHLNYVGTYVLDSGFVGHVFTKA